MTLTRRNRWLLVLSWFAALLVFDIVTHLSEFATENAAYSRTALVLGQLTSFFTIPGVWLLSLAVVLVITLSGHKAKGQR